MRHLVTFGSLSLWTAVLLVTLMIFSSSMVIGTLEYSSASAQPTQDDKVEELNELEDSTPQPKTVPSKIVPSKTTETPKTVDQSKRLQVTQVSKEQEQNSVSSSEVYLQQIQRIESQVNELKEEIFRSRTRLAILKESVLASGLSGTELRIIHRNEMGANFKLERVLYLLDNKPMYQATDRDGELDQQEEIEIYNGPITPDNHTLQVELVYRGNGFGVFSYLQSYRFTLNDVTTFRAEEGKRITMSAIGYERSGVTLELKDRPDIRFDRGPVVDLDEEAERNAKGKNSTNSERKP